MRPGWNVQITPPSREGGYPSVNVEGVDRYHVFYHGDYGAMTLWLLDEVREVGLHIEQGAVGVGIDGRLVSDCKLSAGDALHHAVLHQVLIAVNMVLSHEVAQEAQP